MRIAFTSHWRIVAHSAALLVRLTDWGLRDYGLPPTEWPAVEYAPMAGLPNVVVESWLGRLGLEPTPEMFVGHLMAIFRDVWRVLRDDGTCWLNLGDSYGHGTTAPGKRNKRDGYDIGKEALSNIDNRRNGWSAKQLIGIPWRVVFALQADGWYLRNDIIWAKSNPMPESVTDRCTKSHEYIFLLAKSARYFYDAEAIKEVSAYPDDNRKARAKTDHKRMPNESIAGVRPGSAVYPTRNRRTVWTIPTRGYSGAHFATFPPDLVIPCVKAGSAEGDIVLDPFCGTATVGAVCRDLGRRFIGLDLSETYLRELALPRAENTNTVASMTVLPLFAELAVAIT